MRFLDLTGLWPTKKKESNVVMSGKLLNLTVFVTHNPNYESGSKKPPYLLKLATNDDESYSANGENQGDDDLPF